MIWGKNMLECDNTKILMAQIEAALSLSDQLNLDFVSLRLSEARDLLFTHLQKYANVPEFSSMQ
jgi:hypothetical protein